MEQHLASLAHMSNTCLQSVPDAASDEFFKEEFNADITKVIYCSSVCRANPECTNREAHGAAEILPWLKHLGPLQAYASCPIAKIPSWT